MSGPGRDPNEGEELLKSLGDSEIAPLALEKRVSTRRSILAPEYEEEYVKARRVLLDALEALRDHRSSAILVGAQAIYIHAGDATFGMVPYTTDADIALDPRSMAQRPAIEELMMVAGFRNGKQPGIWLGTDNIQVDLLVPESVGGSGRRAARLSGHGDRTARKVDGLEAVLVENQIEMISSLVVGDDRRFDIRVAGPAALIVAKLYKIWERRDAPRRLENKDAADILRLLQAISTERLVAGFAKITADPIQPQYPLIHLIFFSGCLVNLKDSGLACCVTLLLASAILITRKRQTSN